MASVCPSTASRSRVVGPWLGDGQEPPACGSGVFRGAVQRVPLILRRLTVGARRSRPTRRRTVFAPRRRRSRCGRSPGSWAPASRPSASAAQSGLRGPRSAGRHLGLLNNRFGAGSARRGPTAGAGGAGGRRVRRPQRRDVAMEAPYREASPLGAAAIAPRGRIGATLLRSLAPNRSFRFSTRNPPCSPCRASICSAPCSSTSGRPRWSGLAGCSRAKGLSRLPLRRLLIGGFDDGLAGPRPSANHDPR